jgi:anti-sigma B factor antagonist
MEGIQVSTEVAGSRNQISIIKVGGYIDTTTSSELERALDLLLKQGRFFLIVDLGNVDYISSAGWGIFISEIKSIRENGGDLKLVRMVPDVYEIFELLEFHHILDVYDTVDEAINKFEVLESSGKPVAREITLPASESSTTTAQPGASMQANAPAVAPAAAPSQQEATVQVAEEKEDVPVSDLSLSEKIKRIVMENPEYGAFKIKKVLNSINYGFTKASWLTVRSELTKLNLNDKARRQAFASNRN